jgi:hypothetical protein
VADIDLLHLRHAVLCACGAPLAPIIPGPRNGKPSWQDALCPSCRESAVASTLVTRRVLSELVAERVFIYGINSRREHIDRGADMRHTVLWR